MSNVVAGVDPEFGPSDPPDGLEPEYRGELEDEAVVSRADDMEFRLAVMEADRRYQDDGAGGTKAWFRDYLVPELARRHLRVVRAAPVATDGEPQTEEG